MAESFNDRINILSDLIIESTKEFNRRLEASRAEFDQRMREEKEERKKSREKFDRDLKASRAEFDQRMREEKEERKKSRERFDRELKASRAEFDQRIREEEEQRKKSREKFDRDLKASSEKFYRELEESRKRSEREMAELRKAIGGIGNVQGEIAEDLFRRNVQAALKSLGIQIESVRHHIKVAGVGEYDVVAVNGSQVVVFEIKNKLKGHDITRFLETQLTKFKEVFPEFKDHKVYGGIGALVMSEEQEAEAVSKGLFVLTQGEDGVAHIQGPKNPIIL